VLPVAAGAVGVFAAAALAASRNAPDPNLVFVRERLHTASYSDWRGVLDHAFVSNQPTVASQQTSTPIEYLGSRAERASVTPTSALFSGVKLGG
jgi:hypothetical protein